MAMDLRNAVVLIICVQSALCCMNAKFLEYESPKSWKRGSPTNYMKASVDKRSVEPTLTATPDEINDGEDVTLTWEGIQWQDGDYIAVWCPPEYIPEYEVALGTALDAIAVKENMTSVTFRNLVNMRGDYQFRYVSNDGPSWAPESLHVVVAESSNVTLKSGYYVPQHVHIALANDITEMRVMWTSGVPKHSIPFVQYGYEPGKYGFVAKGTSHTYHASDMCGAPANVFIQPFFRDPGMLHDVLLTDLKPETKYYYRCGSPDYGWSEEYSFKTAPHHGYSPVSFVFYGDMYIDVAPAAIGTIDRIIDDVTNGVGYDFIVHAGDHSYALGFAWIWEYFFKNIAYVANSLPYMVSIGNHEYDHVSGGKKDPSGAPGNGFHPSWGNYGDDSSGECGVPMQQRFHMPDNGHKIFWYSFNYGNVHIVMMSTEHDFQVGSEQYHWIQRDLESVNRKLYPWVVFTGHRPMYTSESSNGPGDFGIAEHLRLNLEPLFQTYKVNLGLWGHVHSYERTCPVFNETCVDEGTVHAVVGTAGAQLDTGATFGAPWSVSNIIDFGYSRIETNATHLHFQFILNSNGTIWDEFWIPQWK